MESYAFWNSQKFADYIFVKSVMRVTIFTLNRNNGIKDIQEKERPI